MTKKKTTYSFYKANKLVFLIAGVIIILDQLTKYIIKTNIVLYQKIPLTSFFQITHTINKGAGFSILQNFRWFFVVFTLVFLYLIYKYYLADKKFPKTCYLDVCVGLLIGGAIGNFIDRLLLGYVTDFIDFSFWPTFNVADSAVSIAAILIIIWLWKN
jgi:signal peptidase II